MTYQKNIVADFISLVDMGNAGDTYDFSPLKKDQEIRLAMNNATVKRNKELQTMTIGCTAELPYDLADRQTREKLVTCHCKLTLYLLPDKMIHIDVTFENSALSHRLRLKIKSFQGEDETIAASPGGTISRKVLNGNIPSDWNKTHLEYPGDIEVNSGFVGFFSEHEQLIIFNKGLKEYQAIDDSIYMTLFSSCSELGKPDLLYRPSRASGDTIKKGHIRIYTPLAQELHEHHIEVMLTFMKQSIKDMYLLLQQFEAPEVYYQLQTINLFYERIDNKIQLINDKNKKLPKEKTYLNIPSDLYVYNCYQSLYDTQPTIRFMGVERTKTNKLFNPDTSVSNLLEKGNEATIEALRIYTVKGTGETL